MTQNKIIRGSEITPRLVEWLWYPYIPYGKVTIIQGDPGEGKSTFVLNLAAMLTRGMSLPFTDEKIEPMNVIYQNTEDDLEDTVMPRFLLAGGDPDRIFFIDEKEQALTFSDVDKIAEAIKRTGARLIVFDPLTSYIGEDISINLANEVRARFNCLIEIAKETKCAIVIVCHMNKMSGTKAIYRTLGSIDIVGSARSCLVIGTSKDDSQVKVMAVQKSNLAEKGPAILFSAGDEMLQWIDTAEISADELVGTFSSPAGNHTNSKVEKAKDTLIDLLKDGAISQAEIMAKMKELGISQRTAEIAKARLGIKSVKDGNRWKWHLESVL